MDDSFHNLSRETRLNHFKCNANNLVHSLSAEVAILHNGSDGWTGEVENPHIVLWTWFPVPDRRSINQRTLLYCNVVPKESKPISELLHLWKCLQHWWVHWILEHGLLRLKLEDHNPLPYSTLYQKGMAMGRSRWTRVERFKGLAFSCKSGLKRSQL